MHLQTSFRTLASLALSTLLYGLTLAQTPAQGPYVLTTYDVEVLASRPAHITVGLDVLTIMEFDAELTNVATGRADLLEIEVQGTTILLRANQNVGNTDLVVNTGRRTALFTVKVDPNLSAPRRYVIGEIARPALTRSTERSTTRPVPTTTPDAAETHEIETTGAPEWLSFNTQTYTAPDGNFAIQYALLNRGEHPIAVDTHRLRISYQEPIVGPQPLPFEITRAGTMLRRSRLERGESEFGTIIVPDIPVGTITLTWDIVELGPGRTYTIQQTFREDFIRDAE